MLKSEPRIIERSFLMALPATKLDSFNLDVIETKKNYRNRPTVNDWNPAPVDRSRIPFFFGFHTCQVVQDFSHQQYLYTWPMSKDSPVNKLKVPTWEWNSSHLTKHDKTPSVFFLVVFQVPIVVCSRRLMVGKASTSLHRSTFSSTLNLHASTEKKQKRKRYHRAWRHL